MGLTARALHNTPIFPTYPGDLTSQQVEKGMVMPFVVKALLGESGIIAFFVLMFMALTSTVSSSMIAVSSILSFDLYKTYLNPRATDKRLLHVSHITVVLHAVFITGVSIAMNYGGANMTWIGYFRPILSCPGIVPLALTLFWSRQTRLAAILSPVLGFFTGLGVWLGTAKSMYGAVNMTTTGMNYPALYGAIASFFSPAVYSVVISLCWRPYTFDWREFLRIEIADNNNTTPPSLSSETTNTTINDSLDTAEKTLAETKIPEISTTTPSPTTTTHTPDIDTSININTLEEIPHPFPPSTLKTLYHWHRIAWIFFIVIVLITFIAWPMPLYRDYIFTKPFFAGWVSVAIVWQFLAFAAVVVFPVFDGWGEILRGCKGVLGGIRGFLFKR